LIIAVISVCLRLTTRRMVGAGLGTDDWLILVSLILFTAFITCVFLSKTFGLGLHLIFAPDFAAWYANDFAAQVIYFFGNLTTKLSILFLYLRIFPAKTFKMWVHITMGVVIAFTITGFCLVFFQCAPVEAAWNITVAGKCLNPVLTFVTLGAINVALDLTILSLPLPQLWHLHMSLVRKFQVIGMFLSGGLVCIVSIFRCIYVSQVEVTDITWTFTNTALWSSAELSAAILSANLPTYRPLLTWTKQGSSTLVSTMYNKRSAYGRMPGSDEAYLNENSVSLGGIQRTVDIDVKVT